MTTHGHFCQDCKKEVPCFWKCKSEKFQHLNCYQCRPFFHVVKGANIDFCPECYDSWKKIMEFDILWCGWECDSDGILWQNEETSQFGITTQRTCSEEKIRMLHCGDDIINFINERIEKYSQAIKSHKLVLEKISGETNE